MAAERWIVNGTDLAAFAWKIQDGKGLISAPALRANDVEVPGRHGVIPTSATVYDAGQLTLSMWVLGVDPDTGVAPASDDDSLAAWHNRVDDLVALFHQPTLRVEHWRPDGAVRRATGRLWQALDFTREVSSPAWGQFSVVIRIPDAFWYDADPVASVVTTTTTNPVNLWEFAGSTAPLADLTYVIGPSWNPQISDAGGSGTWLAYDTVIPAGQSLVYDGAAQRLTGGGGLIVDHGRVRRGKRLTLSPRNPPSITVSSSSADPVTVQVSGKRAFLTA